MEDGNESRPAAYELGLLQAHAEYLADLVERSGIPLTSVDRYAIERVRELVGGAQ